MFKINLVSEVVTYFFGQSHPGPSPRWQGGVTYSLGLALLRPSPKKCERIVTSNRSNNLFFIISFLYLVYLYGYIH